MLSNLIGMRRLKSSFAPEAKMWNNFGSFADEMSCIWKTFSFNLKLLLDDRFPWRVRAKWKVIAYFNLIWGLNVNISRKCALSVLQFNRIVQNFVRRLSFHSLLLFVSASTNSYRYNSIDAMLMKSNICGDIVSGIGYPMEFLQDVYDLGFNYYVNVLMHFLLWLGTAVSGLSLVLLNLDKLVFFKFPLKYVILMSLSAFIFSSSQSCYYFACKLIIKGKITVLIKKRCRLWRKVDRKRVAKNTNCIKLSNENFLDFAPFMKG